MPVTLTPQQRFVRLVRRLMLHWQLMEIDAPQTILHNSRRLVREAKKGLSTEEIVNAKLKASLDYPEYLEQKRIEDEYEGRCATCRHWINPADEQASCDQWCQQHEYEEFLDFRDQRKPCPDFSGAN